MQIIKREGKTYLVFKDQFEAERIVNILINYNITFFSCCFGGYMNAIEV